MESAELQTMSLETVGSIFFRDAIKCFGTGTVSVADPGSGAFLTPGSGIGFFQIPDPKPLFLRAY